MWCNRPCLLAFLICSLGSLAGVQAAADQTGRLSNVLSLKGDVAYGAFLGGDCQICHAAGAARGIVGLTGRPSQEIATGLFEYREGVRANPVMQTIAKRLSDAEIAAVAAYFETLAD